MRVTEMIHVLAGNETVHVIAFQNVEKEQSWLGMVVCDAQNSIYKA